ncbi:hypothetical protein [Microbacterium dextranolyticum]|uniref:Lipoprotein n=1 Tax=Microbacterium dextranolyticum TaxID=36806 RepID=A0A9W6HN05_9MICO|nr:hypothetical protein [Microbacterium dextranolyticum]MBM7462680.1 hypothetical protein [Microbacterium dextranolyticum]GLJ96216.1 hypothetical protein GCM10017591_22790 [Microbacterium dextranolyticum]
MARRWRRGLQTGAGLLLALTVVTACTPAPAPTPTPTGFASDEEAFAAAESTYRAYVNADNASRKDPTSTPRPTDFLTGEALNAEMASERKFSDAGVKLTGDVLIASIRQLEASSTKAKIEACLDVTGTRVMNSEGVDVTPTDRSAQMTATIIVVWSNEGAYISSTSASISQC